MLLNNGNKYTRKAMDVLMANFKFDKAIISASGAKNLIYDRLAE